MAALQSDDGITKIRAWLSIKKYLENIDDTQLCKSRNAIVEDCVTGNEAKQQNPLSNDEILELIPLIQNGWSKNDFSIWLAREVERHHGIN
ncbi:MAG: hypothetical protein WAW61_22475 [Methylococcaceae bacterium]